MLVFAERNTLLSSLVPRSYGQGVAWERGLSRSRIDHLLSGISLADLFKVSSLSAASEALVGCREGTALVSINNCKVGEGDEMMSN